ncbi:hypothetical protein [Kitasatospora sp. NPDC057738]|uniref:hypothetical protein n=1 Tax=Kitasatospora sp. NPDC057738 TaxID=3346233 RepID=UPI00368557DB
MTIPPPPDQPPTAGMPQPESESRGTWWSKNGPWSQPKPKPTNLRKTESTDTAEDQADTEETGETNDSQRIWVSEFADQLAARLGTRIGTILTETPDERAERERTEHEATFEAKGETEQQRRRRHRREAIVRRQRASILWRQDDAERRRRFRRWCILTAASAASGYLLHLPQLLTAVPLPVGVGAVILGWAFDRKMRGGGHVRVTQVRGPAVIYLCAVRIPLASALIAVLGLTPLFALTHH